jgi:hypothetical protein
VTELQLYVFDCLYLVLTTAVAVLTRAPSRRIVGALAGATACGPAGLGIVVFAESAGWWHFAITWKPYFLALMWIGVILWAFVFLLTWRIARRFGDRGLAVLLVAIAVLGPFRDSWFMRRFPEWGYYAPGIAPMLAISGAYVLLGIIGHGTMRLVAGPAAADALARWPWKRA